MSSSFKSKHRRKLDSQRSRDGFSIVELLVSMVVMGIAIAGLTELLWVNTSWSSMLHNKFDNFTSAQTFLRRFQNDIKHARKIISGDKKQILIEGPLLSQFDNQGFITSVSRFTYSVTPDLTRPGEYMIVRTPDGGASETVLRGLIGPKNASGIDLTIFQYIGRGDTSVDRSSVAVNDDISAVIVNLELRKDDIYGKTTESNLDSFIALRSEIFVRNGGSHGQ